jgi:PPOX class probable FMN-dependent enzyme
MERIATLDALHALYGESVVESQVKVADHLTPLYRNWIMASRFCVLSTVGPEGTDATPRGDDGPVVQELDPRTLAMPDWRGNNRLDNLRNIVRDPRASLMFFVGGSNNVMRINGRAFVSADQTLREQFAKNGKLPTTVIVFEIKEVYSQCGRAILRSGIWSQEIPEDLPKVGEILAEMTEGRVGGATYDDAWLGRAKQTLWSDD